jgi:hypothetical protein
MQGVRKPNYFYFNTFFIIEFRLNNFLKIITTPLQLHFKLKGKKKKKKSPPAQIEPTTTSLSWWMDGGWM